ncbi:MAG TPA: hypothetical protein IAB40_06280 [Candidatus Onthocola stercoravium]|nr:hypothetical protein [Candidatus Onthocola stercoravium]
MSNCINRNCRLCNKLVLSQSITFTDDTLVINLPANNYGNCCSYCIILAQSIPETTTINAPVVFTIGTGTTQYPFLNCDCTPIYASQVRTRHKYKVRVNTAVNDGVFKYIGDCCLPSNATTVAQSIPVPTTPAPAVTQANVVQQVNTTARK